MKFRTCKHSDIEAVTSLLKESKLPFDDITEHREKITIAEDDAGKLIGVAALEIYGKIGLFRSLVITNGERNKKFGSTIYKHVETEGKNIGIRELYLLTEDKCEYFEKLGFSTVIRETVPIEIKNTSQFSNLCPASAIVMRKFL